MEELTNITAQLEAGKQPPEVTVREFLTWFDAKKRGYWIVRRIRDELAAANLQTDPDFEEEWIGSSISFNLRRATLKTDQSEKSEPMDGIAVEAPADAVDQSPVWVSREAAYRIGRLDAANKTITAATPDEDIESVITKMLRGGFSQLPVLTNERTVKGMISWQSIGSHLALGIEGRYARDFMEAHHEIASDKSIFDAINIISVNDYVLVKDSTGKYTGIITSSDLSLQFRELTEPFLLLSEIENLVRNLIGQNFNLDDLKASVDSSDQARVSRVNAVDDLTFGEYVRLLEKEERWNKLTLKVSRRVFCSDLGKVRDIRNGVMHFNPEGIDVEELLLLRDLTRFLQQIAQITKSYRV